MHSAWILCRHNLQLEKTISQCGKCTVFFLYKFLEPFDCLNPIQMYNKPNLRKCTLKKWSPF